MTKPIAAANATALPDIELVQICREAADANRAYMVAAEIMLGNIEAGAEPFESLHARFVERTHQASQVPSMTMEGLRAKAALIQACPKEDDMPGLALSLASDIMRLLPETAAHERAAEAVSGTSSLWELEDEIAPIADEAMALMILAEEVLGPRRAVAGQVAVESQQASAILFLVYDIGRRAAQVRTKYLAARAA